MKTTPNKICSALTAALAVLAGAANAIPWNNGTTDSTVNIPGDYATLQACASAFSATAGGINANWTISVANGTYSETATSFFGNSIAAGKTVTLKPAAGATVTFTLTGGDNGAGTLNGGIVIGATNSATSSLAPTSGDVAGHGFIIDGSNNGSTSRNLALNNTGQNAFAAYIVRVVGNSTNGVVKNCIITNTCTSTSANYGVALTAVGNNFPNGWTIQNCNITCNSGSASNAFGCDAPIGTVTANTEPTKGTVITGCTLLGAQRAISLRLNSDTTIDRNTIKSVQTVAGANSFGISHLSTNGYGGASITISNNLFNQLDNSPNTTAGSGMTAMDLSGSTNNDTFYLVYNNMITGFNFGSTPGNYLYRGIYFGNALGPVATVRVYNNSIYMPNFPAITATTLVNVAAIAYNNGGSAGVDIRENIVYMAQEGTTTGGICVARATSHSGFFQSDYNDLYTSGVTTQVGRQNGLNYATLAAWQASGGSPDSHSVAVNPTTSNFSKWATPATDLHFTPTNHRPAGIISGPQIAQVPVDIDGETRDATVPLIGADEVAQPAHVSDWVLY